MEQITYFK